MRNPILSIVIVTFNAGERLTRTLNSILMQRGVGSSEYEVIVQDGGSQDDTTRIAAAHPLSPILREEMDEGIYDAMNRGVEHASGEWLHFLNAGDAFSDDSALRRCVDAIRSQPKTALIVMGARNMRSYNAAPVPIPNLPHRWLSHAYGIQPHCHQATLVHRGTFVQLGGYSLRSGFAADHDLIMRLGMAAPPFVIDGLGIDYEGGGLSERSRRLIPQLLHQVRIERFAMGVVARQLDYLASRVIGAINVFRLTVGHSLMRAKGLGKPALFKRSQSSGKTA